MLWGSAYGPADKRRARLSRPSADRRRTRMIFGGSGRFALLGMNLFLGVCAVVGAVQVVPRLPLEWLAGTPFPNYTVPAPALGVVVGGGALLAAVLLLFQPAAGAVLSIAIGGAIAIFEVVETLVV